MTRASSTWKVQPGSSKRFKSHRSTLKGAASSDAMIAYDLQVGDHFAVTTADVTVYQLVIPEHTGLRNPLPRGVAQSVCQLSKRPPRRKDHT